MASCLLEGTPLNLLEGLKSGIHDHSFPRPLRSEWTFWQSTSDRKRGMEVCDYSKKVVKLSTLNSEEGFLECWNHMIVNNLPYSNALMLFRGDIQPLWEDKNNRKGGKFAIVCSLGHERALQVFKYLCKHLIYDLLGFAGDICGAVFSIRDWGGTITVWNRDSKDPRKVKKLGDGLASIGLSPENDSHKLLYQPHSLSMKVNRRYQPSSNSRKKSGAQCNSNNHTAAKIQKKRAKQREEKGRARGLSSPLSLSSPVLGRLTSSKPKLHSRFSASESSLPLFVHPRNQKHEPIVDPERFLFGDSISDKINRTVQPDANSWDRDTHFDRYDSQTDSCPNSDHSPTNCNKDCRTNKKNARNNRNQRKMEARKRNASSSPRRNANNKNNTNGNNSRNNSTESNNSPRNRKEREELPQQWVKKHERGEKEEPRRGDISRKLSGVVTHLQAIDSPSALKSPLNLLIHDELDQNPESSDPDVGDSLELLLQPQPQPQQTVTHLVTVESTPELKAHEKAEKTTTIKGEKEKKAKAKTQEIEKREKKKEKEEEKREEQRQQQDQVVNANNKKRRRRRRRGKKQGEVMVLHPAILASSFFFFLLCFLLCFLFFF
eukprot:CAMPEP_0174262070 /NCGR_PEP_ID=MMETSP0439-20130205/12752_1 /TAXON_ID=0 /ORGANISM="Stereomyxa ramosa, Strain Chinc5" /LENGTH=603 /DNA_ID=CAMNT_0015346705 /DNA_START=63 /DNA_END=1874 /DNA_ORIENTATION=-